MNKATLSTFDNFPLEALEIKRATYSVLTRSMLVVGALGVNRSCLFENLPLRNRLQINAVAALSIIKNKLTFLDDRDDYFFPLNLWGTGYHHWLAEVAVKFILFEKKLRLGKILLPANYPAFIGEFLDLFGFDNIVTFESNIFVRRVNVITNPNSGHFNAEHMALLRTAVLAKTGTLDLPASRNIYVTRRNARARRVTNEDEVVRLLEGFGYECLDLENRSFLEQIEIFAQCKNLISIHGAALTNAIFMANGGSVTEIYPAYSNAESELNACYKRLCGALGHSHKFLFGEHVVTSAKANFHTDDVIVDIDALARAVR